MSQLIPPSDLIHNAGMSGGWKGVAEASVRWAVEQLAGQWPMAITCRPPTAKDADDLGYVQYLDDRGFWSIRFWYNVALHNQPWVHTPAWRADRHPSPSSSPSGS